MTIERVPEKRVWAATVEEMRAELTALETTTLFDDSHVAYKRGVDGLVHNLQCETPGEQRVEHLCLLEGVIASCCSNLAWDLNRAVSSRTLLGVALHARQAATIEELREALSCVESASGSDPGGLDILWRDRARAAVREMTRSFGEDVKQLHLEGGRRCLIVFERFVSWSRPDLVFALFCASSHGTWLEPTAVIATVRMDGEQHDTSCVRWVEFEGDEECARVALALYEAGARRDLRGAVDTSLKLARLERVRFRGEDSLPSV